MTILPFLGVFTIIVVIFCTGVIAALSIKRSRLDAAAEQARLEHSAMTREHAQILMELDRELGLTPEYCAHVTNVHRVADIVLDALKDCGAYNTPMLVGSLRRQSPNPGDVDVLIIPNGNENGILGRLEKLDENARKATHGWTANVDGVKVHVIKTESNEFGQGLLMATGSATFNKKFIIPRAKKRGFVVKDGVIGETEHGYDYTYIKTVCRGKSEADILDMLGLSEYLDPTTRDL